MLGKGQFAANASCSVYGHLTVRRQIGQRGPALKFIRKLAPADLVRDLQATHQESALQDKPMIILFGTPGLVFVSAHDGVDT